MTAAKPVKPAKPKAPSPPVVLASAWPGGGDSEDSALLRKAVNTLAIVPKSARITTLGRKTYNVLLFQAQEQGLDKDVFRVPLEAVIQGLDYDSHDQALIKKHLRAMVSTTVEWQSPTTGEGSVWNVSGLLAHARLGKERGQVWVEWSYAVNLKQELLAPTVFARLRLEVISQLRSHAGVALYEICTRYKDVGRTARQAWRWWVPVLTGNPASEKTAKLEYRFFKRDTLGSAVAEINALTDIQVELVEHRKGRFVDEIQFRIAPRQQAALALARPPAAVDLALMARAQRLGVADDVAESLAEAHGALVFAQALDALERRQATRYPEPLRDPVRYLRALLPAQPAKAGDATAAAAAAASPEVEAAPLRRPAVAPVAAPAVASGPALGTTPELRELRDRRQARWRAEWTRRRHDRCAADIAALSDAAQQALQDELLTVLAQRQAHPSISKRLRASGWQHPMVRHEMLRYFGSATYGENWDQPSAEQLLAVAAENGADSD